MANGKSPLKILGPEIIGLLVVFAIILGVLNYFNILSLSQLYHNQLGWLPQQSRTETQGPYPVPTPTLLTSIPCPIDELLCSSGRLIATTSGETNVYALAYKLPRDTTLRAVFRGTLNNSKASGEKIKEHPFVRLRKDNDSSISAEYLYFGSIVNEWVDSNNHDKGLKIFNLGEKVGDIEGEATYPDGEPLNGANFLFFLKQNDQYYKLKVSGDKIILTP